MSTLLGDESDWIRYINKHFKDIIDSDWHGGDPTGYPCCVNHHIFYDSNKVNHIFVSFFYVSDAMGVIYEKVFN